MAERLNWCIQTKRRRTLLKKFILFQIDCQNYVRVYGTQYDSVKNQTSILICGTNAYNPKCRTYPDMETNLSKVEFTKEFPGKGFCPYNPQHNSTTIFASKFGCFTTCYLKTLRKSNNHFKCNASSSEMQ